MEQFKLNNDDLETTAVKIKVQPQVMIEKWKLVLLIVGCTSFLFLIYFPIDFFLYRRRKRMARERQSQSACRSSPVRAAQYHAKVTPPNVSAEIDYNELNEIEQRKYRAQRGVIKFLNMLKMKKSSAEMLGNGGLTETVSSAKNSSPRVNIIPELETISSVNGSVKFLSENEVSSTTQKSNYTSYDDDYFDYTPEKRITKTTKRWHENQNVDTFKKKKSHLGVKFDTKMSKFAANKQKNVDSPPRIRSSKKKTGSYAMGPLENTTDFLVESTGKECLSNSIRSNNDEYVEPMTKIRDRENHINLNNISKIHKEVISNTNNLSSAKTSSENVSDGTTSGVDDSIEVKKGSASKYAKDDTALMFQTNLDKESEPFARYKKLNHSQSELCMVRKPNLQKLSHKNGRKRNVISPLYGETCAKQMNNEESSSSDKSMPISIPLFEEYSETQKVIRKKKKKSVLKKACSGSVPDLFFKTEAFNCVNE